MNLTVKVNTASMLLLGTYFLYLFSVIGTFLITKHLSNNLNKEGFNFVAYFEYSP